RAWGGGGLAAAPVGMTIERQGSEVFSGEAGLAEMVRAPAELCGVLHSAYPLPAGAWLLTGTSIVPPPPYTAAEGDQVTISIDGLGQLTNRLVTSPHSGATALPPLSEEAARQRREGAGPGGLPALPAA